MLRTDEPLQAACRVCGATNDLTWYDVREMQLGMREWFRYFQCPDCGSLQIGQVPSDLARFYPQEYFSFSLNPPPNSPYTALRGIRNRSALTGRGRLGRFLTAITRYPFGEVGRWLQLHGATRDSRILDVGCGAGQLLCDLAAAGYRNLIGVDPFLASDVRYPNGVQILRRSIHELEGAFDFVLFVHSFEHVTDPVESLASAARLLDHDGRCIVWSPTVPCEAWDVYRENWVQVDAPRHILIPTPHAMRILGASVGLQLECTQHNSTDFQFVGSELYRRDIPFVEQTERMPRSVVRSYRKRAKELNARGRGDQAAFFFSRS